MRLHMLAHFGVQPAPCIEMPPGEVIYSDGAQGHESARQLARGAVHVTLEAVHGG
jgi:maltooligosyltrehalose trehalohydrolase